MSAVPALLSGACFRRCMQVRAATSLDCYTSRFLHVRLALPRHSLRQPHAATVLARELFSASLSELDLLPHGELALAAGNFLQLLGPTSSHR